jgi:hypothetical protein
VFIGWAMGDIGRTPATIGGMDIPAIGASDATIELGYRSHAVGFLPRWSAILATTCGSKLLKFSSCMLLLTFG